MSSWIQVRTEVHMLNCNGYLFQIVSPCDGVFIVSYYTNPNHKNSHKLGMRSTLEAAQMLAEQTADNLYIGEG